MGDFVKVAAKSEIAEGNGKTVQVGETPVALFKVAGNIHAIHDTCLHRGGPLGEGALEENVVTCPWHGWQYDVTTGTSAMNPSLQVQKFDVKVEGDDILVKV